MPCVIVAELRPLHSSSDFTLQNPPPRVDQTPRNESIRPGDFKATTKSKCDAFNKGATTTTPPSHIHNGPGFHPWTSTLGDTRRPQQGKRRPMASPSPRLSPKTPLAPMPSQEAGPLAIQHLQTPLSCSPMKASSEGNDALAARGSRTATSTPLRPGRTWGRTSLHRSRDTAAHQGRHGPPSGHRRPDPERQHHEWTLHLDHAGCRFEHQIRLME